MLLKPAMFSPLAITRALLTLMLMIAAPQARAADVDPETPAKPAAEVDREKILDMIDHLGSADPAEREEASKFLSSIARQAEPLLAEAAKGDDAEIAARAGMLLRRIHAGIKANTPKEIVDLVAAYEDAGDSAGKLAAAEKLLQTPESTAILVRLWASEPNVNIRTDVGQVFRGRSREFISPLLAAGAEDAVLTLLENDASLGDAQAQDYVAALLLTNKLDEAIARLGSPDSVAPRPAGWLYLAKRDLDGARKIAERSHDDRLLRAIEYAAGDWKSLAAFYDGLANKPSPAPNALYLSAAFHLMSGDEQALDADLQRITRFTRVQGNNSFSAAEIYLLVGRVDDAIGMLKVDNASMAFELLCQQMRFAEAFALLDAMPKDALWRFNLQASAARWYHRLGHDDDAVRMLDAAQKAFDERPDPQHRPGAIAGIAWALGMKERAVAVVEKTVDPKVSAGVVGDLFGARRAEAELFWPILQKSKAGASTIEQLNAMEDLLVGRTGEKEVRTLADAARKAALQTGPADSSRQMVWIARLLASYGINDAAEACLQRVPAQAATTDGYLMLGDRAAKENQWPEAARLYATAAETGGGLPLALYLEGRALNKSGKAEEGAPLIRRAKMLPLAGDERGNLIRGLMARGLHDEADEEAQLLLKVQDFWSSAASEAAQRRTRVLAEKGDFAGASDLLQRGMLIVFRSEGTYVNESAYLDAPRHRDELQARDLIAKGKTDEGAALLRKAADRYPADVDWLIKTVRSLEKSADTKALADELFNTSFQRHEKVIEENPKAASLHNGLAWLCARTGRELDAALKHADQAVAAEPDSSAFLDTLAEVHFRRGENAKAVELAKKCVDLTPRSDYFKSNVKRFAGGNGTSETNPPEQGDEDDGE